MAQKAPVVVGSNGLPQQVQSADRIVFDREHDMAIQSSDPAVAPSGYVNIFGKKWAEFAVPTFRGMSGVSQALQGALWNPRIRAAVANFNNANMSLLGAVTLGVTGTATAVNLATTNLFTRTQRIKYLSGAVAASIAGIRNAVNSITTGNGAGLGGFFFSCRFGCSDAATVSGARQFVGVGSPAAPSNVEPSTLTNHIGVGHGAADTNLKLYSGGSSAQTPIDLGVNFPANTLSVDMYELTLFSPSDATGIINYKVERINTGDVASGTLSSVSAVVLPQSSNTLSALQAWRCNNATALAVALDFSHVYTQTDK